MSVAVWIIVGLMLWTIASVWYFLSHLGDKHNQDKDPWYMWVLGSPMLLIAVVVGLTTRFTRKR